MHTQTCHFPCYGCSGGRATEVIRFLWLLVLLPDSDDPGQDPEGEVKGVEVESLARLR